MMASGAGPRPRRHPLGLRGSSDNESAAAETREMSVLDDGGHPGELLVQERVGVTREAQRLAGILGQAYLMGAVGRFLAEREVVFISAQDDDGHLWTSPVFGPPGFCQGHGRDLTLAATVVGTDPLRELCSGRPVGMLVIDFARRRRLRINGTVSRSGPDGIAIAVQQAYPNCPRRITPRELHWDTSTPAGSPEPTRPGTGLDPEDVAQIVAADTFVLGTVHPERGADTSHRGGEPGFVRCAEGRLWWPDYGGNNLFNSLGNLVVNPAASLLFVDFDAGTSLQLAGHCIIDWAAEDDLGPDEETGRRLRFTPDLIVRSTSLPRRVRPEAGTSGDRT